MSARTGIARVWDWPTRLFHWSLVALFGFCWWSAEYREMEWHVLAGLILLGLLLFRLIWGVIGGSTARFTSFVSSPLTVIAYLRNKLATMAGHNPVGGYSVIAMLAALIVQSVSGLFATDVDGLNSGQLSYMVSFDQGRAAAKLHDKSFNVLLALVGLHVLAILYYLVVRRRNLIGPMLTGRDRTIDADQNGLVPAGFLRLAFAVLAATALAWWTAKGLEM